MSGFAGCVWEFVCAVCVPHAGRGWFAQQSCSLQPLSFTPNRAFCAAKLPFLLSLFSLLFFFPLSLVLPQLDRFQIWLLCSNDTLPTTHKCTARAVKNVSVFPRNTLPEGALNDVPGSVNSGDADLLFLRCLLAPPPKQE